MFSEAKADRTTVIMPCDGALWVLQISFPGFQCKTENKAINQENYFEGWQRHKNWSMRLLLEMAFLLEIHICKPQTPMSLKLSSGHPLHTYQRPLKLVHSFWSYQIRIHICEPPKNNVGTQDHLQVTLNAHAKGH